MKLFLMRHGIAAAREEWTQADASRPLTPEGIAKTRRAARGLCVATSEEKVELIAASPLLRAQQSAEIARELLGVPARIATWPELENAAFVPLLARLHEAAQSTLMVGHEPGLSRFTSRLLCGSADALLIDWKKAAVCALEVDWLRQEARATLKWFATPKQLRAMGRN